MTSNKPMDFLGKSWLFLKRWESGGLRGYVGLEQSQGSFDPESYSCIEKKFIDNFRPDVILHPGGAAVNSLIPAGGHKRE